MERVFKCEVQWNGEVGFEVKEGKYTHTVNIEKKSCTCRAWNITGLPCPHGMTAIYHKKLNLEDSCSEWYKKDRFLKTYGNVLHPVRSNTLWTRTGMPCLKPPDFKKKVGRPQRCRRKDPEEPKSSGKLSRKGIAMKCSKCHQFGHNKVGCKSSQSSETNMQASSDAQTEGANSGFPQSEVYL